MKNNHFNINILFDQSPSQVFKAITNVRGWWSEEIDGATENLNDEFNYRYKDIHTCKMKLIEVTPDKKITWLVLDNYFNFTKDEKEWQNTKVVFEITQRQNKTLLQFTHEGLVPELECFGACSQGWTQYIKHSLQNLITTGQGTPNGETVARTTHEVALRFNELAQQEKWFEIQDELFAEDVKSIEPATAKYLKDAFGKESVRKKGEDWVKRITALHHRSTTAPIVAGNYFTVGRAVDITVQELGRIQFNEIMLYEVKDGKIVTEQFFY